MSAKSTLLAASVLQAAAAPVHADTVTEWNDVRPPHRLGAVAPSGQPVRQVQKVLFQIHAIPLPGLSIDTGSGVTPDGVVGRAQPFDGVDVMQQSGELRIATTSCRLSYAVQRSAHVIDPHRSAGHARPNGISLGSQPSLHRLRRRGSFPRSLVRQILRYYAAIRLPAPVAHRRVPLGFTMRAAARLSRAATAGRGTSRFPCEVFPRVREVCDRAGSVAASPSGSLPRLHRCGLRCISTTSAPRSPRDRSPRSSITRLDTRPARTPVNASPTPSRMCAHDSGPP